ncbi:hypothetical protein [Herpetosiphon geysericola]|uniref:Uncharacterized protein n=1 Tax=Herpetosiphon geysericola TaxID=70996 RepID=A0A0N8GT64_9CHLR|nr:hypothetical protein [Herpetosiphon geysericola]KPL91226.1 hypothetical protein SE18_03535 [Herpetosiphon geysericola]
MLAFVSTLLIQWIVLRPLLLGISATYVVFARNEPFSQRLFLYCIMSFSLLVGGLFARKHYLLLAPIIATASYLLGVCYLQNLLLNPDLWKLSQRGYSVRMLEIASLALALGWLVDRVRQAIILSHRKRQALHTATLYPNER